MKTNITSAVSITGIASIICLSLLSAKNDIEKARVVHDAEKPTIVLVHGAFADGSSWNKVIPILQKKGYKTIAVQNPLTSLKDDVAFTERAIAEVTGKVILVGHSYGGVVITQAGNNEKVAALVYVAAYAPDEGQSIEDIEKDAHDVKKIPAVPGLADPIIADGFIRLKDDAVVKYFAQDLPEQEARLIAAGQGRFHISCIQTKVTNPAWKNKPSYFAVAENDHIIAPEIERQAAKKIGSTTISVPSSHVAMLAQPQKIADLILQAAVVK
ncbi:alpha/beta hydrolase [Mucilaginibacter gynuensis]|uniref:Alpha/beta hydrolase n=1 Tax=Mucilaginibacter gynuensis TaxID=1302236 RepID=A0ABP8FNR7_9SPHI